MVAIYLHIAFCKRLCPYCDFVRTLAADGVVPDRYVAALLREIERFDGPKEADTIFFGGGTPSLLHPAQLERILAALAARFHLSAPEITLEANADDVTPELVSAWHAAGINRVSLGVQSFDDAVLRYLGRRHDAATARRACETVAECFENWSMDLIFGAPPIAAWIATLQQAISFAPPHLSAYGLTYETGTPFEARRDDALDDDAALALYQETETALAAWNHYEISNYARPGRECRHNLRYWHNEDYAGFGAGAYGYINGVRARNHADLDAYLCAPGEKEEASPLTPREIRQETCIQHFRLKEGLSKEYYRKCFGNTPEEDFASAFQRLLARGLLEDTGVHLRPTPQGFYLNNEIGLELVD